MDMLKRVMRESTVSVDRRSRKVHQYVFPGNVLRRGDGRTSGVAYDTAWAVRVTDSGGHPLFPAATRWLLENQKPDGSWGSQKIHYHDRIISTLGAIFALKTVYGNRFKLKIEKGEKYIWKNIENLEKDNNRLIGSELLFPALMHQAEKAGLNLPFYKTPYRHEYTRKLQKIDESMWYSPETTLSFSLEFLGDEVDIKNLPSVQLPNGSVANSPAATAFFLTHIHDSAAVSYLREILSCTQDGSMMTVYPVNTFEYGWVMYNLLLAHVYQDWYSPVCAFLSHHLHHTGIGCSTESPLSDADDTAIILEILSHLGYPVDFSVFDIYQTEEYFLTYQFEMDPSVSTNIHMFDLVTYCLDFPEREEVLEKVLHFLKKTMNNDHWIDKWHVSPYYPTCHAVFPLCHVDHSLAQRVISWIIDTQNSDGTWGIQGGSVEETAYALQALLYYDTYESVDLDCTMQAMDHLHTAYPGNSLDALWIGKVLYCPPRVVQSSVLSAELMHKLTVKDVFSSRMKRGGNHAI
jgi:hypothetical protein